ncbi:MAG: Rrf2 family transcriptional regulator, partial [Bacteroidota bacterium]
QTNPVVVRRVLGQLRKAGLLHSQKGHAGGWRLARDPKNISLADIYLVLDERLVARGEQKGSSQCSVELSLQARIAGLLQEIEKNLLERLQETSIAELQQGEDIKTRHL